MGAFNQMVAGGFFEGPATVTCTEYVMYNKYKDPSGKENLCLHLKYEPEDGSREVEDYLAVENLFGDDKPSWAPSEDGEGLVKIGSRGIRDDSEIGFFMGTLESCGCNIDNLDGNVSALVGSIIDFHRLPLTRGGVVVTSKQGKNAGHPVMRLAARSYTPAQKIAKAKKAAVKGKAKSADTEIDGEILAIAIVEALSAASNAAADGSGQKPMKISLLRIKVQNNDEIKAASNKTEILGLLMDAEWMSSRDEWTFNSSDLTVSLT